MQTAQISAKKSPDQDVTDQDFGFQNVIRTFLFKDTRVIFFYKKVDQFFQVHEPHCGKMPHFATLKNPSKIPTSGRRWK